MAWQNRPLRPYRSYFHSVQCLEGCVKNLTGTVLFSPPQLNEISCKLDVYVFTQILQPLLYFSWENFALDLASR